MYNEVKDYQKTVALSFMGSTLAGFLVFLLTRGAREFKSLEQIYVEHNSSCIPLTSFIEKDSPEIVNIAASYFPLSKEDYTLAAYNWVAQNIDYPKDGAEVWYLPSEVINNKVSGCFGTSVLAASLLRQKLSPQDVFVAIGTYRGGGHAWCVARPNQEWVILETTRPNHFEVDSQYSHPVVLFNDRKILGLPNAFDFLEGYVC